MTETGDPAGRTCPLTYRYPPESLGEQPEAATGDVLYVVGGIYGNLEALTTIEQMLASEQHAGRRVQAVFNGDFHWFDADPVAFAEINRRVFCHTVITGNVEWEVSDPSFNAGCGCAYPDGVDQVVVDRSNRIMNRLQSTAIQCSAADRESLQGLPRYRCLIWSGLRVLVLHGDPESLAGWGLSRESLGCPEQQATLHRWFRQTDADLIVCTHTCLPAIWQHHVDGRLRTVVNNGAAGMGNLAGDYRGLLVRLSRASTETALARVPLNEFSAEATPLVAELVPVTFDLQRWWKQFGQWWPEGSDARLSYERRILQGVPLDPSQLRIMGAPPLLPAGW